MSKPIRIKFDNNLPNEEVRKALLPSSVEEGGYSDSEMQETKVTGIYTPLVKLNNMVIPWEDIMSMHLSSIGFLPELSLRILDRRGSILNIDTPCDSKLFTNRLKYNPILSFVSGMNFILSIFI